MTFQEILSAMLPFVDDTIAVALICILWFRSARRDGTITYEEVRQLISELVAAQNEKEDR